MARSEHEVADSGPRIGVGDALVGQPDQDAEAVLEDGIDQLFFVGEAPVDGRHPDAGLPGHVIHAGLQPTAGKHGMGGDDDPLAVAHRVAPGQLRSAGFRPVQQLGFLFSSGCAMVGKGKRNHTFRLPSGHVAPRPDHLREERALTSQSAATSPVPVPNPRRWLILAVVATAQLMVVLDATIVNIALPSAQHALGFANTDRQWIITAYALAFGSLLLLGGKVSDIFGRKWSFIIGLAGFAGASALGGAAGSFGMLVAARALQGVFGALLAPTALSTLATTFTDPSERGKAYGIFGAIAAGGSAVGLVLGGILTEGLSWRYCLYVNLLFAAAAAIGALILLEDRATGRRPPLDVPGTLLASSGLFCIVYGFSHAATASWANPLTVAALAVGVILLGCFVAVQKRVAHPLLPLRVILERNRGGSYLSVAISAIAIFGVFLFLTYYLQQVKGYSPIITGVAFLPLSAAIVVSATSSNVRLLPKFGPRPLVAGGMLCGMAGMLLLSRLDLHSGYATSILPPLIILGLGFGLIFAPAINEATAGVAPGDAGVASAMVNTMQQVGGSIGTALLSTLAVGATTTYLRSHHAQGRAAVAMASVHGYRVAFLTSAAIFAVGAIMAVALLNGRRPSPSPTAEPAAAAA